MNGIITYTDNIIKYMSGKKSAGKNIQTTDGFAAYITSTGVAKPYKSIKDLNNKNGCTTKIDRIITTWGDMGFPVGSLMVEGQSCGNETKYIRSNPPQTVFDWKFYVATYPDLNLTKEAEALDHWNRIGMAEGLLPNDKILLSMTNLGKIVDDKVPYITKPCSAPLFCPVETEDERKFVYHFYQDLRPEILKLHK